MSNDEESLAFCSTPMGWNCDWCNIEIYSKKNWKIINHDYIICTKCKLDYELNQSIREEYE